MRKQFTKVIEDHRLLSPGDLVLVALSGGPDSVVLLHLLLGLAPGFPFRVRAAHLDHGIRAESGRDADFVRRLCESWGVDLSLGRADVPALARAEGRGLEEAGRLARREFLREAAAEAGCGVIALGHHRGDQAETLLHRLMRGSGLTGLAAMRLNSPPFIRPLLPFSKDRILTYLKREHLPFVEDASNADPRYTRNRIRHELLPLMREFNPRVEERLADLTSRIAMEEDFWEELSGKEMDSLCVPDGEGLRLDRTRLHALHPALRARVLRRALSVAAGEGGEFAARHLAAVENLILGERPQGEVHLPGLWAGRRYEALLVGRNPPTLHRGFSIAIEGPGCYPLPCGGELAVSLEPAPLGEEPGAVEFDADKVGFPLLVRSFRPGDRFRPSGMEGSKKLKDFFIDEKISRESRALLPLVVGEEILWVAGLRRCAGMGPRGSGTRVLRMVLTNQNSMTIGL